MKLKYRILWFEDDDEVVKEQVGPKIKDFLSELGFDIDIVHFLNGENLETIIKDRNFDLVVTDLNLGDFETGEALIDHIREGKVLTEVLLYSASTTQLTDIIAKKGAIERASFCTQVANLLPKLKEIIGLTIRKHQDVNNIRGLVIAETIDLERKIEKILLHYFDAKDEKVLLDHKIDLLAKIHEKKVKKSEEDLAELKNISFTQIKLMIEKDILTANNSFEATQSILNNKLKEANAALTVAGIEAELKQKLEEKRDDLKIVKQELDNFRNEILKIRNTLAHVQEELGEDGIPFLKSINSQGTVIQFDNAKYIEIRKNLHKHNVNLDKVLAHIEAI